MKQPAKSRAMRNIAASLANQVVSTLCGILLPRVMIASFGSAVYGAAASIAQMLSGISLLDGGIGRVARGALYRPLAEEDWKGVSRVYQALRRFYAGMGLAFLGYALALSLGYYDLAGVEDLSREYTFALVWAIGLSTLAKYLWGMPSMNLLNADQRQYVVNTVVLVSTMANGALILVLTRLGCGIVAVKLGSSLIFVLRPMVLSWYVRRRYDLPKTKADKRALEGKWTGLGQHLAYTVHSGTDVLILTLFADLGLVSVYSVHSLIINSIRNITGAFSGGMEAVFGRWVAKGESQRLHGACRRYQVLLSMAAMILFGVTGSMILPFVRLYTAGISDAEYIQPVFAQLLLLAEAAGCLALPWATLPVAANRLKQTRWGAYGEAALNLTLSFLLVRREPLAGVALGTLISVLAKGIYDLRYCAKHILRRSFAKMLGEFLASLGTLTLISVGGMVLMELVNITSLEKWILWAAVMTILATGAALVFHRLMYPEEFRAILAGLLRQKEGEP